MDEMWITKETEEVLLRDAEGLLLFQRPGQLAGGGKMILDGVHLRVIGV